MKPTSWIGILLIVLGALALVYQGSNYTRLYRKQAALDRLEVPRYVTGQNVYDDGSMPSLISRGACPVALHLQLA